MHLAVVQVKAGDANVVVVERDEPPTPGTHAHRLVDELLQVKGELFHADLGLGTVGCRG